MYQNTLRFFASISYFPLHYLLNIEIQLRYRHAQFITRSQTWSARMEADRNFPSSVVKKRIILNYNVCVACIIYWWFSIVGFLKNLLLKCYRELNCKRTDEKHNKPVTWYSAFQVLVNDPIT